jgi:hypothetical protein
MGSMTNVSLSCASCEQPNAAGSAFCVRCGTALTGWQAQPAGAGQAQSPPPRAAVPPPMPPGPPPHATLPPGIREHPASLTQRGFLASLFDVSFTSMVGTKLVRAVYVLTMIWVGLLSLIYILLGFHQSVALGVVMLLIVAPVIALFMLGFARLALEICIALFQIMANTNELVAQGRRESSQ